MVPGFSGAQISFLLSHIIGFCDRNRGSFHGLSQTRGVVATNEMKNTNISWLPPILAISLQCQTKQNINKKRIWIQLRISSQSGWRIWKCQIWWFQQDVFHNSKWYEWEHKPWNFTIFKQKKKQIINNLKTSNIMATIVIAISGFLAIHFACMIESKHEFLQARKVQCWSYSYIIKGAAHNGCGSLCFLLVKLQWLRKK